MPSKLFFSILLCVALSPGCARHSEHEAASEAAPTGSILTLPVTFSGVLPCADCEGIHCTLNLYPDSVFFLRQTYLGKGEGEGEGDSFHDLGRWAIADDNRRLILRGGGEAPLLFAIKSMQVLRKLELHNAESMVLAHFKPKQRQ